MRILTEWLQKATGIPSELYGKLFTSLACIIVFWFFRWLILMGVWRRTENSRMRYEWRKISNYLTFILSILLIGRIWIAEFESLTTFLGLMSAGLAIAMKDSLVNVAGWLFILWRRPFEVGDRIQVGAYAGDVIDMRIFSVHHLGDLQLGPCGSKNWENRAYTQRQGVCRSSGKLYQGMV